MRLRASPPRGLPKPRHTSEIVRIRGPSSFLRQARHCGTVSRHRGRRWRGCSALTLACMVRIHGPLIYCCRPWVGCPLKGGSTGFESRQQCPRSAGRESAFEAGEEGSIPSRGAGRRWPQQPACTFKPCSGYTPGWWKQTQRPESATESRNGQRAQRINARVMRVPLGSLSSRGETWLTTSTPKTRGTSSRRRINRHFPRHLDVE